MNVMSAWQWGPCRAQRNGMEGAYDLLLRQLGPGMPLRHQIGRSATGFLSTVSLAEDGEGREDPTCITHAPTVSWPCKM